MPVQLDVWRIDEGIPKKVAFDAVSDESKLESVLEKGTEMLGLDLLVVGRQVPTAFGKIIDLLCIDSEGDLHIIELKRDKTPRDIVGQVLDYASWVRGLGYDDVVDMFSGHSPLVRFEEAFDERFGVGVPEAINENHHMVIVAGELDMSTERIVGYLSDEYGVTINAILFRHFTEGGHEYLARTWLVDPAVAATTQSKGGGRMAKEPWNGQDFYVSFGEGEWRSWEDAIRYGFVSGGGGKWYSQTLKQLFVGARVFVNIPQTGYVGVGVVTAEAVPARDFVVDIDGYPKPIFETPHEAPGMANFADDDEKCEWMVGVDWIRTVRRDKAVWEKGMYANQNTVTKLRNSFTIERLTKAFDLDS